MNIHTMKKFIPAVAYVSLCGAAFSQEKKQSESSIINRAPIHTELTGINIVTPNEFDQDFRIQLLIMRHGDDKAKDFGKSGDARESQLLTAVPIPFFATREVPLFPYPRSVLNAETSPETGVTTLEFSAQLFSDRLKVALENEVRNYLKRPDRDPKTPFEITMWPIGDMVAELRTGISGQSEVLATCHLGSLIGADVSGISLEFHLVPSMMESFLRAAARGKVAIHFHILFEDMKFSQASASIAGSTDIADNLVSRLGSQGLGEGASLTQQEANELAKTVEKHLRTNLVMKGEHALQIASSIAKQSSDILIDALERQLPSADALHQILSDENRVQHLATWLESLVNQAQRGGSQNSTESSGTTSEHSETNRQLKQTTVRKKKKIGGGVSLAISPFKVDGKMEGEKTKEKLTAKEKETLDTTVKFVEQQSNMTFTWDETNQEYVAHDIAVYKLNQSRLRAALSISQTVEYFTAPQSSRLRIVPIPIDVTTDVLNTNLDAINIDVAAQAHRINTYIHTADELQRQARYDLQVKYRPFSKEDLVRFIENLKVDRALQRTFLGKEIANMRPYHIMQAINRMIGMMEEDIKRMCAQLAGN